MSTRGAFIIAKNNEYKELFIWSDAYPDEAGREVVNLIKTADLDLAFDHLIPCKDGKKPDGEDAMYLSLRRVEDAGDINAEPYYYRTSDTMFIYDSISCEYGYLADLDHQTLEYYTGRQDSPQEGNRFGTERYPVPPTGVKCYPCGLRSVFSFQYVRGTSTPELVRLMEEIKRERPDEVKYF